MSGFLHRLAARTLAQKSPLHSRIALPFAELATHGESTQWTTVPSSAAVGSGQAPALREGAREPVNRRGNEEGSRASPSLVHRPDPIAPATRQKSVDPAASEFDTTAQFETGAEPETVSARDFTPLVARSPAVESPDPANGDSDSGQTGAPTIRSVRSRLPSVDRVSVRPETRETRFASSTPSDGPAPEVHIRIGRIEVIATAPPSPSPKPAPRRETKTMPLEEYLARRARGKP